MNAISLASIRVPEDLRNVIDSYRYKSEWRTDYKIQSFRSSLQGNELTCIDAAILAYGLLETYFPNLRRRLMVIHRRDEKGEECGHCIAIYWNQQGQIGSLSKSSLRGLEHRDAVFSDEQKIAMSYAEAYLKLKMSPLCFGVVKLEEVADDLDWRSGCGDLNPLLERLKESYYYEFVLK